MSGEGPDTARTRLSPEVVAEYAGLRYVSDSMPGISRRRCGTGWSYADPGGETIQEDEARQRIADLVIPPAWTDVWICPDPDGHLQATGRDARGRKQYRYHPRFREARDLTKFSRLIMFGMSLPRIRRTVEEDLAAEGLPRRKTMAAAVRVLDRAPIRVGNERYARLNDSYGLTTMRERHVEIEDGGLIRFRFRGKSGKEQYVGVDDVKLARVLRQCSEVPGWELFKYFDESGTKQYITSDDVNTYLRTVSGYDFTAKDFRTWAGTVRACTVLRELGPADTARGRKKKEVQAVRMVAADLGNTPATCRSYYIHPGVLDAYLEGRLLPLLEEILAAPPPPAAERLREDEWPVMALLPRLEAAQLHDEDLTEALRRSLDMQETPADTAAGPGTEE